MIWWQIFTWVILVDAAVVPLGSMPSCAGRCGILTPGQQCQCISWCRTFENCCQDYYLCHADDDQVTTLLRTTAPRTTLPPTTLPPTTLPPTTLPPTTLPPTTLPPTTLPPTTLPPTTLPPTTLPPTTLPPPSWPTGHGGVATPSPRKPMVTLTTVTTVPTTITSVTTTSLTTRTTTSLTTVTSITTTSRTTVTTITTTTLSTITSTSRTTVTTVSTTTITSTTMSTTSITTVTRTTVSTTSVTTAVTKAFRLPIEIGNVLVPATTECSGFGPKEVTIRVRGMERRFILFLPKGRSDAPLWLAFHGSHNTAKGFLSYSRLHLFTMQNGIGLLALQGLPNKYDHMGWTQFNVGPHSQPSAQEDEQGVHDLEVMREILEQVLQLPCIDKRRIHCTGYSNGARFCIRLASEMSDIIASVAVVSGLRYPKPNNAGRPIPILAFHGLQDHVNPFQGHGDDYWQSSVPEAFQSWAKFNQCGGAQMPPTFAMLGGDHALAAYRGCQNDATVELMRLDNAGHQWPNALYGHPGLGQVSSVDGNVLMRDFFSKHRLPEEYAAKSIFAVKRKLVTGSLEDHPPRPGRRLLGPRGRVAVAMLFVAALAFTTLWALRRRSVDYHELRGALIESQEE